MEGRMVMRTDVSKDRRREGGAEEEEEEEDEEKSLCRVRLQRCFSED